MSMTNALPTQRKGGKSHGKGLRDMGLQLNGEKGRTGKSINGETVLLFLFFLKTKVSKACLLIRTT